MKTKIARDGNGWGVKTQAPQGCALAGDWLFENDQPVTREAAESLAEALRHSGDNVRANDAYWGRVHANSVMG